MNSPGPSAGAAKVVAFDQVSPPRLLFALLHQRFTGTMQVEQPDPNAGTRTIWFDGGMPVFTDWSESTDVLGQVLVDQHVIDETQLLSALETMASSGGLLGQILLQSEIVDIEQLKEGLRKQCARKLSHIFGIKAGKGSVAPEAHNIGESLAKVNVLELILAGVGAYYDAERVESELGAALYGPLAATDALRRYVSHFRFRPGDELALKAISRGTTLQQLATLDGCSNKRGAQLIYTLWACQMLRVGADVKVRGAPAPTRRRPTNPPAAAAPAPAPRGQSRPNRVDARGKKSTDRLLAHEPGASPPPSRAQPESPATRRPKSKRLPTRPGARKDLLTELEEIEEMIESGANAFELLGVPLDGGKREVRRAWSDLSKRFHPDGLKAQGREELKDRVGKAFAAMSEAQTLLSDKEKREKLKDAIERGDDPKADEQATSTVRAAFEAELVAKDADRLVKAGKFDRALEKYQEALQLNPDEPYLQAARIWCQYNLSPRERGDGVQADRALEIIVKENPKVARAHYYRGLILKNMGAADSAMIAFKLAHQYDVRLVDAERQLRALKLAKDGPTKKPSGLRGLFSKR